MIDDGTKLESVSSYSQTLSSNGSIKHIYVYPQKTIIITNAKTNNICTRVIDKCIKFIKK
jgi:hypothetical protein